MTKKHNKKTGYSLLEVSIAMLIIGILLTSGSVLFSKLSQNQNIKQAQLVTLERTDKIYKAILNYLSENHRLPCPAKLNSSYNDADYGNESRVVGEGCNGATEQLTTNTDANNLGATGNMKILYGMIPINVLDLDKKDAEDGYGNKFSYIMVKEFGTKTPDNTAEIGFEYLAGSSRLGDPVTIDYINVKSRAATLSNKSIMLIISHGENGLGAYIPDSGIQKPTVGVVNDEDSNMYKTNYNRIFFADSDESKTANNETLFFDDYVIFKNKDQLLRDAEMEFIKCGIQQGFINQNYNTTCLNSDFTPARHASYGETITIDVISPESTNCGCVSSEASLQRVCGKYGKWSDISCNENHVIHQIDEVRARNSSGLNLLDDGGNGIFIKDGGAIDATHLITGLGGIKAKGIPNSSFYADTETSVNIGTLNNLYAFMELNSSDNSGGWIDFTDASGADLKGRLRYVNLSNQFQFFTDASLRMSLNSTGLGIGTATPSERLHVNGSAIINGSLGLGKNPSQYAVLDMEKSVPSGSGAGINLKNTASGTSYAVINLLGNNGGVHAQYFAGGESAVLRTSTNHALIFGTNNTTRMTITSGGNVVFSDSLSKGSGSFDIPHPDPKKTETHRLRHYFVETPSAGGNIYKYQIECEKGDNYIDLPDYYQYLNKDSLVWVNPVNHFGRAWGEVEDNKKVRIVVDKKGTYNILIFGDRKDEVAMKDFNKYGIEYKNKK
tara:strand:+ start:14502 stop:16676 length:2175 start_codon:yes stop_codon:yes gene_type:complete